MAKNKKGFKPKYVLIPIAVLMGTAATIFACIKIRVRNF